MPNDSTSSWHYPIVLSVNMKEGKVFFFPVSLSYK